MITTETEAKNKTCPVLRQPAQCIGRGCMAWRWQPLLCDEAWEKAVHAAAAKIDDKSPHKKLAAKYVMEHRTEFGLPAEPFRGWCGMAGKPEA